MDERRRNRQDAKDAKNSAKIRIVAMDAALYSLLSPQSSVLITPVVHRPSSIV
jgi:hypothetical protein